MKRISVGNTLVNLIHATNILPSPQSKTFKNISTTYTNFYPLTLIARLLLQVWNTTTKLPLIWQIHANVFFAPRNRCSVAFWLASSLCDVTITTAYTTVQGWPAVTFGGEIKYGGRQLPSKWRSVNYGFSSSSSDIHSFLRRYIIRATLWSKWEPPEWSNWMASFKIYGGRCLFTHGQPKLCV